jgi:hypothetical protein
MPACLASEDEKVDGWVRERLGNGGASATALGRKAGAGSVDVERAVEFCTCARVCTMPVTMEDRLLVSLSANCEGHGGMRFVDKVARDLRGIGGNAAVSEEAIIRDLDRRR